jgi:Ca-activated chloride channel family protein
MCLVLGGWLASGGLTGAAESPIAQDQARPTFRAGVDLVSIAAVVRDGRGRVVRDLTKDDFQIYDGGQLRPVLGFSADEGAPTSLALLFDVSGSMQVGLKIAGAREAARHILSWLRPGVDEAAMFAFDTRLRQLQPFSSDAAVLQAALDRLEPFGATSLYDAIGETAERLVDRPARRRAVIVLTDTVDTASRLTPAAVSGVASALDVPVYGMAVLSPLDDSESGVADADSGTVRSQGELSNLAEWTGGEFFVVSAPAHASLAARKLLLELRHQYLIAFEASAEPGWHRLEIRTKDPRLSVRARGGYVTSNRAAAAAR